jgi:hypothetical protein
MIGCRGAHFVRFLLTVPATEEVTNRFQIGLESRRLVDLAMPKRGRDAEDEMLSDDDGEEVLRQGCVPDPGPVGAEAAAVAAAKKAGKKAGRAAKGGAAKGGVQVDFCFKVFRVDDFGGDTLRRVTGECVQRAGGGKKTVVGSLEGSLLIRGLSEIGSKRFRFCNFHSICDDISKEMQEISTTLCNADGSLRPDNIDGLGEADASWADEQGFFHLETLEVDETHRHQDLGVRFLRSLLEWLNTDADVDEMWTFAIVEAGTLESEHDTYRKALLQFARLGFRQQAFGSSLWYIIPRRVGLLAKSEVGKMEISHIPKAPEVKKGDRPLIAFLDTMSKAKPAADFGKKLDKLCAAGAKVARALALHHAIDIGIRMSASDIGHLIRLKADINAKDHVGNTPLHIMASSWMFGMDPDQTRSLLGGGAHLVYAQKRYVSCVSRRPKRWSRHASLLPTSTRSGVEEGSGRLQWSHSCTARAVELQC